MSAPSDPGLDRVVRFFESLSRESLATIDRVYAPDAWFKDPFNEVQGLVSITAIFEHMFEQVDSPRFVVRESIVQGESAMLVWDFEFAFRSPPPAGPQVIRGCSHLRFDAQGRVAYHRDYWDAAEELYAKLPLVGPLVRWMRRRGGAAPAHRGGTA